MSCLTPSAAASTATRTESATTKRPHPPAGPLPGSRPGGGDGGHDGGGDWPGGGDGGHDGGETHHGGDGGETHHGGDGGETQVGVTDQQSCEKAGGIWASGYCGKGFKLQGPTGDNPDVPVFNPDPVGVQILKCIASAGSENITGTLEAVYTVSSGIESGKSWFQAMDNGHPVDMIWGAGGAIPGPIGTTFTCAKIVKVYIDENGKEVK
ncbi:hypothetical protein [Streptomyces sp. NBC_00154]|uniref:hypothetical protein n=1 Tax=Streptomyces sp. NBC_00154 TaxID=2975670 RepID=UPI00225B4726|nr:hypothetical protein [Streptomyces sp. NBC_00154]MCX5318138.1 hypothetical protein [Streptomyces sp. NBC_00154]